LEFKITNNKSKSQTINISTADFNTLDESGGLVFVGTNPTKLQEKYGLATWLTIPENTVTIAPKQTATITAFVLNQPSMASGGHYGALMLALTDPSTAPGQNKVAVHPIASSLLFVDKVGGDRHVLKLSNVYASHSIFSLPSSLTLRFKNDGNTHLVPRGVVTITDSGGKLISKGVINENSSIILPETYRRFSVPLTKISTPNHPGKYTMRVDFRFDGYDQFRSYQSRIFLLLPSVLLIAILAIIAVGFAIYFSLKNHTLKKHFVRFQKSLQKHLRNK
jgi:hypothetical protein